MLSVAQLEVYEHSKLHNIKKPKGKRKIEDLELEKQKNFAHHKQFWGPVKAMHIAIANSR